MTTSPEQRSRFQSLSRRAAIPIAVIFGLIVLIGQLLAVVPITWTTPLMHSTAGQNSILAVDVAIRDQLGSWNIILAVAAATAAFFLWRTHRTRWARALFAGTGIGLVLCLVTGIGLAAAAHNATGTWIVFAPRVPMVHTGNAPNRTITYTTFDGTPTHADLYLPAPSDTPAPLVVSIHGGGFTGGRRSTNPYTTWLAEHGYAVMDVDYRVSDRDHHRWDTEDADVGCAMTWAAANARHYHWDLRRVATFGGSAGGNLAINVAYKINDATLHPTCGTAADLPKVRAAIGNYPAVDITGGESDSAYGAKVGQWYVGGTPADYPGRYASVDSAPQISRNSPATLILQGRNDHLVFAFRTAAFAKKLTGAGIANRYIELPFVDHAFDGGDLNTGTQVGRTAVMDWLQRYDGA